MKTLAGIGVLAAVAVLALWLGTRRVSEVGTHGSGAARAADHPAARAVQPGSGPRSATAGSERRAALPRASNAAGGLGLELSVELECAFGAEVWARLQGSPETLGIADPDRDVLSWRQLAPGTYGIELGAAGWRSAFLEVELDPVRPLLRRRVRLEPLTRYAGRVFLQKGGVPLRSFLLQVETRRRIGALTEARLFDELPVHDEQGRFCLAAVDPEREAVRFHARAPGLATSTSRWFEFAAAPFVEGIELGLRPISQTRGALRGRVVSAREPGGVADVELRLAPEHLTPGEAWVLGGHIQLSSTVQASSGTELDFARSDSEGWFRIETEAPRGARLVAFHPDYRLLLGAPLTVEAGTPREDLVVVLDEGARIHGQVLESSENLHSRRLAQVWVESAQGATSLPIGEAGRYSVGGLAAGVHTIQIKAEVLREGRQVGYRTIASEIVSLAEGEQRELDFDLSEQAIGARIEGRASLPEEARIADWSVRVWGRAIEAGARRAAGVRPDGGYGLAGVPDGDFVLVLGGASADRTRAGIDYVDLRVEGGAAQVVELDATRSVVHFQGPARRPGHPAQRVRLDAPEADERVRTLLGLSAVLALDPEGRGVLWGLRPGSYAVALDDGSPWQPLVVPVEGGLVDVSLE